MAPHNQMPHGKRTVSPKVTVCVVTYNQKNYIADCLQSLVDQVTDFEFEVIVSDDCSTDETSSIVAGFAERHATIVRHIRPEKNIGPFRNFSFVHGLARGTYVAHVDGDDFTLPGKLQAQVDVLDASPDVAFAAHAMRIIGSEHVIGADPRYPQRGDVYDLLRLGTYFAHSSVMYRRDSGGVEHFPEQAIDYYMHIERAAGGAIHLDKRVLGAYRYHASGLSGNPEQAAANERYYEQAFDRALELGLDADAVQAARIDRRMKFAVARCLAGDTAGYRRLVRLGADDWRHASVRHKLLHLTRALPIVVKLYFAAKRLRASREPARRELP